MERKNIHLDPNIELLDTPKFVVVPEPILAFGFSEILKLDPKTKRLTKNDIMYDASTPTMQNIWESYDKIYASTQCYLMDEAVISTRVPSSTIVQWVKDNWDICTAISPDCPYDEAFPWDKYTIDDANNRRKDFIQEFNIFLEGLDQTDPDDVEIDLSNLKPIPTFIPKNPEYIVHYIEKYLFINEGGQFV